MTGHPTGGQSPRKPAETAVAASPSVPGARNPYHDRTDAERCEDLLVARLLERMPGPVRDEIIDSMPMAERDLVLKAEDRGWRDRAVYEREHGRPMMEPLDPARDWAPWVERWLRASERVSGLESLAIAEDR